MAKILMLSLVYGPDTVSTANFMTDIAHGLQEKGHQVTVLTSMPHYNPAKEVRTNPIYRAAPWRLFTEAHESAVRVLRVYMPLKRNRVWLRVLDYLWFHFITMVIGLSRIGPQDVIFVPSPPITLGLSGYALALFKRAKLIYDIRELWPDAPVRMGLIRNPILLRLVYAVEAFVYRRAVRITSIANSFNENLTKRGVPSAKLRFTPNFVDVDWLKPGAKSNAFACQYGLEDRFVAFYAGNIGLTQGLEVLVEVAQMLEDEADVVFLIIGDGAGREKLEQAIKQSGLMNIRLLPFQPYALVPDTYATADVCLSPMRAGFCYDTVPSKLYTAMAAGRPVIAAAEADTETAQLIRESHAGIVVAPESASEMAHAIRRLRQSSQEARVMGQNARQWIVERYSKAAVIGTYDQVIREAAQQ